MAQQPIDKFTDESFMWFGKHRSKKLANVPASYLLWWYREFGEKNTGRKLSGLNQRLEEYVLENMDTLIKEDEKATWGDGED